MSSDLTPFQEAINNALDEYKAKPNFQTESKANAALDLYEIQLDSRVGSTRQYAWLKQKKGVFRVARQKNIVKDKVVGKGAVHSQQFLAVQDVVNTIDKDATLLTDNILKKVEMAKTIAQEIKEQLALQIEKCNEIELEYRHFDYRWKRVKTGIKTILKNAMSSRLTRGLAIFLVLVIIALITVSVLQAQGIIKSYKQLQVQ